MFQQIPSCSQADRFNLSQARKQFDSEGPINIKKLISNKVVQLAFKNEKPYPVKTDFKCKIKSYGECYCQFGQVNGKKVNGLARLITLDGEISEG
jgi:hypothetical protein